MRTLSLMAKIREIRGSKPTSKRWLEKIPVGPPLGFLYRFGEKNSSFTVKLRKALKVL